MFVCSECGQRHERPGYCPADGRPLVPTDDPLLGTDVGRYRLASLLGEGGMGRVYLGVQPMIGSRVAVKILSDQCARDRDLLERFFAEAKAVNLIRHESIASVLDLSQLDDGRPYIVMEYIEGTTLGPLVRLGTAPLGGVIQVMTEVLSALSAAHAIGIVHRDLKPDNILVTAEGHAKVLDFGIAKLAPGLSDLSPRTRTGALLGTPGYMAPEQITAGQVDPRTDIYAAGVVLYEAVTGRVPFEGETLFDLMRQHLEVPPRPPSQLRADLPPSLERVILTALAKDPAARFQSAIAMAEAATQAAAELAPDHWRALSRSGGSITGGRQSISKIVAPPMRRNTPPNQLGMMATVRDSVAAPPQQPRAKRRWPIAVGAIAIVAGGIATGIVVAVTRSPAATSTPPPTNSTVAGSGGRASVPPLVIGGGSAADHGVYTGPNVVIGSRTKQGSKPTAPIDFDPKRFDVLGYLPKARALARKTYPDAEFTEFEFYENVRRDGSADLTLRTESTSYYEFRSPARSVWPADRRPIDELPCYVMVDITATEVTARVRSDGKCDHSIHTPPKCTLAKVWQMAATTDDDPTTIGFLHDGKWFFDQDHSNKKHNSSVKSFADCR